MREVASELVYIIATVGENIMSQTLNFATLVANAPVVSRSGGGRSGDPRHCHYSRIKTEKSDTATLKLPLDFLSKYGFKSGFVSVVEDVCYVIMSSKSHSVKGRPFSSFHQRPDTRHLVISEGDARTYLGKYVNFSISPYTGDAVKGLSEDCSVFILEPETQN